MADNIKEVEEYVSARDWRVRENANLKYSFSSLFLKLAGEDVSEYCLKKIYPRKIAQAHTNGDFHIHNLYMGIVGYCAGWSIKDVLLMGFNGIQGNVESSMPKHFSTALLQLTNFIGTLQNEWAGAQAFNSLDTLLAPFVRKDKLDYKEIKQQMQQFVYNLNISSRWGGQCVSEDTETLTDNGWKKYNEIDKKDKIATFNINNGKIEFLKPSRVLAYNYEGELISLKNRTQNQIVTPNHKVVRKKFNSNKFEFIKAKDISFKTSILIPLASETTSKQKINENMLKLCAWLVSEGSFSDKRICIYQSEKNTQNCEEIRYCLKNIGYSWYETSRISGFSKNKHIRFRISYPDSRKIRKFINKKSIPRIIKTLSAEQIRLFLDTYIKGDGNREKGGRIRIYTKDPSIRDDIQELCAISNYGSTVYMRGNGVFVINIIRNPIASITKISKVKYKGKVWCPTTKNCTFVARRDGKVFITGNTPFTNITFDLKVPEDLKEENVIYDGKVQQETYGEYQEEIDLINRAFFETMIAGDMHQRIFTFPIPTYNLTKDFDWSSANAELLFEMAAKYGVPYFQNFIKSDLNPRDIRAMCCRLQLNLKELHRRIGGFFGYADKTGSVGVVTINMPRLGYVSKNEMEFFERLGDLMDLAKQSLEIKRKIVQNNIDNGLLPFSKRYLGSLNWHFSTIGLIGMNEACLNFLGKSIATPEGKAFAVEALKFMRKKIKDFQKETGQIYNLEATPAEGASHRLARIDKKKYPRIITAGRKIPYYTNSTHLPVGFTDNIFDALKHQEELQVMYTGGTIFHGFLGERIDAEACRTLAKKIAENFKIPYFTITPTFSVCMNHGYLKGEHFKCPVCKKQAEVYSRIVGYFRPVQNWHIGKQEEFRQRKEYKYT